MPINNLSRREGAFPKESTASPPARLGEEGEGVVVEVVKVVERFISFAHRQDFIRL